MVARYFKLMWIGRLCGSLSNPWLLAYAISTIISCWLGCSLLIRMFKVKVNSTISVLFVCLFDLIFYVPSTIFQL